MSLISINQSVLDARARAARLAELKQLLLDTDYKVLPDYDKPDAAVVAQRQAWRDEIRAIEGAAE